MCMHAQARTHTLTWGETGCGEESGRQIRQEEETGMEVNGSGQRMKGETKERHILHHIQLLYVK